MTAKPFLNPKRQKYALIAGAILWFGWLTSLLIGKGNRDAAGQIIGTDFLAFYTGGKILLNADSANLYNFRLQHQIQESIVSEPWPDLDLFVNPPFFAWFFVPFAVLPYRISVFLWLGLGLAVIALGVRWLYPSRFVRALAWGLSFYPIFAGVSFGQNAPLSLVLFCLTYTLWQRKTRFFAGIVSSLLLYKPQLILGIGLFWLLEWRKERNTLAGLTVGGTILAAISFLVTPQASLGYLRASRFLLSDFPPWHAYATRTFWINLLPNTPVLPDILYIIGVIIGFWVFRRFFLQRKSNPELLFGAAICLSIWITPHLMVYDWGLLLIPAIILWKQQLFERHQLIKMFALVWISAFLSGPLTLLQMKLLPFSIQISIPILAVALGWSYRVLSKQGRIYSHANSQEIQSSE